MKKNRFILISIISPILIITFIFLGIQFIQFCSFKFLALGDKNLEEGKSFDVDMFTVIRKNECARGLTPVIGAREFNGSCVFPMCNCYVCTKCGDSICGKGENFCNCPKDCEKGESDNDNNEDIFDVQVYESNE